jgi:hypothetical protein
MHLSTIRKIISRGQRPTASIRLASEAKTKKGVFRDKSAMTAWTEDPGTYPMILGIGGSICFAVGFGIYYFFSSPDVRVVGESRKKLFRGELNECTRETESKE